MQDTTALISAYTKAQKRLLLLDYDGTLREFEPTPPEAIPSDDLLESLRILGSDPKNTVVIISGREQASLIEWFGKLPVSLSAEHGLLVRDRQSEWEILSTIDLRWKDAVRSVLQRFVDRVPMSFIEEKTASIAWHYRNTDAKAVDAILPDINHELELLATHYTLNLRHAAKVIEIGIMGVDKGTAVKHFLHRSSYDFILAMGDEDTDEDMFRSLPSQSYTIKIRNKSTVAKMFLPDPSAARHLLHMLGSL